MTSTSLSYSITETAGSSILELERTPGTAAVSLSRAEELGDPPGSSPISALIVQQIPGAQGMESPGSPYLDLYAKVVTSPRSVKNCPQFYVTAECVNGHRFAKKLVCGREYCPTCGADWSDSHQRRFARWLLKLQQLRTVGYFVFTMPEGIRDQYRTKAALNELTKRITCGDKSKRMPGLLKDMGFSRGLCRWHWFGDGGPGYHPHLNVLVEAGYLGPELIDRIKSQYAEILGVPMAVVNYSYAVDQGKMVHILKYVTRATFRQYEWDDQLAEELYRFRSQRCWGEWTGEPVWQLEGEPKFAHIEELEKGICPECGKALRWGRPLPICLLPLEGPVDIGAGYYRLHDARPPPVDSHTLRV